MSILLNAFVILMGISTILLFYWHCDDLTTPCQSLVVVCLHICMYKMQTSSSPETPTSANALSASGSNFLYRKVQKHNLCATLLFKEVGWWIMCRCFKCILRFRDYLRAAPRTYVFPPPPIPQNKSHAESLLFSHIVI